MDMVRSGIRRLRAAGTVTLLAALTVLVPGCDDGSGLASPFPRGRLLVQPSAFSLALGANQQLAALMESGGTIVQNPSVTWSSTDTSVVRVSQSGLVTAVGTGTASVVASSESSTQSGEAEVTVTQATPTVASVVVAPNPASVAAGSTMQLGAIARDASGNSIGGHTFTWTSTDTNVATVSSSGVVSGMAVGTAAITATTAGVSGSSNVTVTNSTVATVAVSPNPSSVQAGVSTQLTATAYNAEGNVISGRTFTWTSSNTAVATVGSSGLVSGLAEGTSTITAATGGVSGTSSLTVTAPPPSSGAGVLWFSDWRTATGNSQNAVSDGGKWDFVSAEYEQSMDIISSAGLDFPTANVFRVIAIESRTGWAELRHRSLPLPSVGQSRFYRWYIRVTMPDGLSDYSTHPIQDNYAQNWAFYIINAGGGSGVPNGMWRPEFWSYASAYPNDRWRGPLLEKNRTYRVEMQVELTGTNAYRMHVRVYDSSNALVFDDNQVRNNNNSVALSTNPTLTLGSLNALNGITAGCNGITPPAPWPFTSSYQAAFAVCANSWCGPYNGQF